MIEMAVSELDFKMIDNAYRQTVDVANLILPYANTWQMYQ